MSDNTSDYQSGRVQIEALAPHPNADRLEIAVLTRNGEPFHYQVVVGKGQYVPGDFAFCLLVDDPSGGSPVATLRASQILEIERTAPPGLDVPVYGVENLRHGRALACMDPNTEIEVTEKIHGMNIRFVVHGTQLFVGSHRTWRKGLNHAWGRALLGCAGHPADHEPTDEDSGLIAADIAAAFGEGVVVYGEVYGAGAQDLTYDHRGGSSLALRVFDAWSCSARRFVEIDHLCVMVNHVHGLGRHGRRPHASRRPARPRGRGGQDGGRAVPWQVGG